MLKDIPDNWQHADIDRAVKLCKQRRVAVDVGAHRGVVTKRLLDHFQVVIAIEPSELAWAIDPRAKVMQLAVGRKSGWVNMQHGVHNTGQRHVVPGDEPPRPDAVRMARLDDLDLGGMIDFIKIDVEGLEADVLAGGAETIRRNKPVIMFETNGLNRRYDIGDDACSIFLQMHGADRMMVMGNGRDKDEVWAW